MNKSNIPYKFLIGAAVVLSLTFCSLQSKHESVPMLTKEQQQHIINEDACIRESLFYEARGEPLEGQLAVLSVIQNRKNSGLYPSTFCGVIKQKKQFSYRNGKGQGMIKTAYKPTEEQIKATIAQWSFQAAVGSFKGTVEDSVIFYHAASMKVRPKWATGNKFCAKCKLKSKNPRFYCTIGQHHFYRS